MCNDYAREIEAAKLFRYIKGMDGLPPFSWSNDQIPNDIIPKDHIRISDKGLVRSFDGENLIGSMTPWAWKGPRGAPVFNFKSDDRSFSASHRVLIPATGFYEYTTPAKPTVKLRDQHYFEMAGQAWFWIAGIVKQDAFAMLTCPPGADLRPYHDRQICLLEPGDGMAWLGLDQPEEKLLRPTPIGTLKVKTLRRDGIEVA